MRVLVICTVPFEMNGIVSVIMNYFRLLNKEIKFDFLINKQINKHLEDELNRLGSKVTIAYRKKNLIAYIFTLYILLKKEQYDIVHIHGNSASMTIETLVAKICGIQKRIVHCHNTKCTYIIFHNLLKNIFRKTYTDAIACSEEAGEWIFGKGEFKVIENGIDVYKYEFSDIVRKKKREELSLTEAFVVGHIGLFNEQKNHEKLFSVFEKFREKHPEAKLLCIAGNRRIPSEIESSISKHGIKQDTIILLERNDVSELLQAMDFFVFPSKWEGLGMVVVEAQASGLFCLTSDKVPMRVDVTDNCIHIPLSASDSEWCEAINKYMNKKVERAKMNVIVRNSDFNINQCKRKMLDIYQGIKR